jgi:hypothetical protein
VIVASSTVVADLLAAPTDTARVAYLRSEGLADETGLDWLLDRVQELVHDEPGMAEELAELCGTAAARLQLGTVDPAPGVAGRKSSHRGIRRRSAAH